MFEKPGVNEKQRYRGKFLKLQSSVYQCQDSKTAHIKTYQF